jgi:hypothetical protein
MTHNADIQNTYTLLIDILLHAEGDKSANVHHFSDYNQNTQIQIPSALVPLLYAASNCVQMAVAFLPYYLKNYAVDNQSVMTDLKKKIIDNDTWFTQEIYPLFLKFLLSDTMRTFPVTHLSQTEGTDNPQDTRHQNMILYDAQCTYYPPYYGINIHDLPNLHINDSTKTLYLIGDIHKEALDILIKKQFPQTIYGITPLHHGDNHWQNWLHRRLHFFSKTVLAGSLNMQLPFIEHYLQAGIAPFSFYHLLYRSVCPQIILKNALCLLNNKQTTVNISDYIAYKRVLSHTDLHILSTQDTHQLKIINYLTTLCLSTKDFC